jgi:hypothetical protein
VWQRDPQDSSRRADTHAGQRADETTEGSGWITTDVATAALGVSPRIVRRYIDRGDLAGRVEE